MACVVQLAMGVCGLWAACAVEHMDCATTECSFTRCVSTRCVRVFGRYQCTVKGGKEARPIDVFKMAQVWGDVLSAHFTTALLRLDEGC